MKGRRGHPRLLGPTGAAGGQVVVAAAARCLCSSESPTCGDDTFQSKAVATSSVTP